MLLNYSYTFNISNTPNNKDAFKLNLVWDLVDKVDFKLTTTQSKKTTETFNNLVEQICLYLQQEYLDYKKNSIVSNQNKSETNIEINGIYPNSPESIGEEFLTPLFNFLRKKFDSIDFEVDEGTIRNPLLFENFEKTIQKYIECKNNIDNYKVVDTTKKQLLKDKVWNFTTYKATVFKDKKEYKTKMTIFFNNLESDSFYTLFEPKKEKEFSFNNWILIDTNQKKVVFEIDKKTISVYKHTFWDKRQPVELINNIEFELKDYIRQKFELDDYNDFTLEVKDDEISELVNLEVITTILKVDWIIKNSCNQ